MTVTPEDRDAMARLLSVINGDPVPPITKKSLSESSNNLIELAGPGQATTADIAAMADVLSKLNSLSNHVVDDMITESTQPYYSEASEAFQTERTQTGVKIGRYQILIKEDAARPAGKQFYSVYNSVTNNTIADDISLYETALTVVRLLNSGKFANSAEVRKLFEQDDAYTSHKLDAIMFKRKANTTKDIAKRDIFESRLQASMDRCMMAKKAIKLLAKDVR
jgi:hypothetical protein